MKFLSFIGIFLVLNAAVLSAAPSKISKKTRKLESQIKQLNEEVSELRISVDSLNRLSERLSTDLSKSEDSFRGRLSKTIIHLMQWPEKRWGGHAESWMELQRLHLVMERVRLNLVHSPLKMITDRELRISEVDRLKNELSQQMMELEAKQSLLDVQLEELKNLESRMKKKVSHATGKTKVNPEDLEPKP